MSTDQLKFTDSKYNVSIWCAVLILNRYKLNITFAGLTCDLCCIITLLIKLLANTTSY